MKSRLRNIDKPLFISMILMSILGLVMVFSSSSVSAYLQYGVSSSYFFKKQLIVMTAGYIFGLLVILRIPIKNYNKLKSIMMIGITAALVGLLLYSKVTNGAQSWYRIGFFSLQPSEFAKAIIIVYLASFFDRHLTSNQRFFFLRPIVTCAAVVILIFLQPDLGTAAIIALLVFIMFMAVPFSKSDKDVKIFKIFGIIALVSVVFVMVFGGELLNSEQASRLTYKKPCTRYALKTGYQVCNGMIAINNGGLFGVGLGNSTQKYLYLPEGHTDFIFPIIVEELGSIVGAGVILLYLFIIFRLVVIARRSNTLAGSLISFGTAIFIMLHLIINIGGLLALIPLTGVPLPLLSYGGSSTLTIIGLLFISLRVSMENQRAKE